MPRKSEDITGQRFGRLVAIEVVEERIISGKNRRFWRCKCDCGNETIVMQGNLTKAAGIKSCGCLQRENASAKAKDLTGQRFGKLVVTGPAEPTLSKDGRPLRRWNCKCDCGNELIVLQNVLTATKNGTKSCGCSRKDYQRKHMEDLSGRRFGRLVVMEAVDLPEKTKNGTTVGWRCLCDCGKEIVATRKSLVSDGLQSCGCLLSDTAKGKVKTILGSYKGTKICAISEGRKINKNNSSGVNGVYWSRSEKKWMSTLGIKGKIIKRRFGTKEEAVEERKRAEKEIYEPIREEYEQDKTIRGMDLTGKKYGKLTVIGISTPYVTPKGQKQKRWICKCDCGKVDIYLQSELLYRGRTDCGCESKPRGKKRRKLPADLSGMRFGKLTAIKKEIVDGKEAYLCRCDCGNEKTVLRNPLVIGKTKSCGCLVQEKMLNSIGKNKKFSTNKTGVRGVNLNEDGTGYMAYIYFNGKQEYLGTYETLDEAAAARHAAEILVYSLKKGKPPEND